VPRTSERTNERRPVTRLDPAVRRVQIVEAAARLFEDHDPLLVTFEEIADAAGVSRALVYNYFGDRGGLLAAVFLHHFASVNDAIREAVAESESPEDRFGRTVRAYLDFAVAHPGAWRLLSVARLNDHPAVVQAREIRMLELADAWGGSTEARITAYALVGMLEAATLDWLRAVDEVPVDAAATILLDLIWRGLPGLARHGITVR
jgi:AcrR family transcriptional regulator